MNVILSAANRPLKLNALIVGRSFPEEVALSWPDTYLE